MYLLSKFQADDPMYFYAYSNSSLSIVHFQKSNLDNELLLLVSTDFDKKSTLLSVPGVHHHMLQ